MRMPKRWLIVGSCGDAEDARELVLQRAGQVEVEVGGGEAERAVAAARQEGLQRGLVAGGDQPAAALALALGAEQVGVERGGVELGLLLGRGDLAQQPVDRLDRLRRRLVAGPLGERRQLQQLQVAGDRPVDVDGGVEPRLRQLPARLPGGLQHLLAQHAVGRVQPLGRAEQLLLVRLLLGPRGGQRRGVELRGAALAVVAALDPGEDEAGARRPADPLRRLTALQPEHEDVLELHPLDRVAGEALHGARRGRLDHAGRLDPGVGDGAEVADEVAGRAVRLAPRPGGRQLGEPREAEQPLGDLGLGGEESLAAQADRLDQPPHEDVGATLLHRRRGCPVELEEGLDPLPRLGRDLRALERRLAGRRPCRACGGGRSSSAAPGRPSAARSAAGSAPAPPPPSRPGSASTRSQAIASRTSGRWKSAAGPGEVERDAALLHRRRHRPAPLLARRPARRSPSGAVPPASRCSTSRATACACARSLAQRQKRDRGVAELAGELDDLGVGVDG